MPDTHTVMPSAYRERNAARQHISSLSSNSRAGAPLLRNIYTAAVEQYSTMASLDNELLGAEDSFWDEVEDSQHKPDLLETAVQQAGLLQTPQQSLSSWLANLDKPPSRKSDADQIVPVAQPLSCLPKNEDVVRRHLPPVFTPKKATEVDSSHSTHVLDYSLAQDLLEINDLEPSTTEGPSHQINRVTHSPVKPPTEPDAM